MNLKQKTIKGLFWSFFSQGGRQISQFIITIILARALTPRDFGLVGMVVVLTNFFIYIGDLGFDKALIQKQDVTETQLSSVFWINVILAFSITTILIILAPAISHLYRDHLIAPILAVISLCIVFNSFGIIQRTILTKKLDFKALAMRNVLPVIIAGIVAIFLAYSEFGVWSLVFQLLTLTLSDTIFVWIVSGWRPKFIFRISSIENLFSFSFNMMGSGIVQYMSRNADYFLIGIFLGPTALGYYTLAYKLMMIPLQFMSQAINSVIFPVFSMIKEHISKIRESYIEMVKAIAFIIMPIMSGLFILASEFVLTLYGKEWEPAILLVRILCFVAILQSICALEEPVTLSQGKARLHFKLVLTNTLLIVLSVAVGLRWGIYGVAVAYFVQQLAWFLVIQRVMIAIISLKYKHLLLAIFKPAAISAIMIMVLILFKNSFAGLGIVSILMHSFIGMFIYIFLFWIVGKEYVFILKSLYSGRSA